MNSREIKSCVGCKYYYVTWDKYKPKGCKAFGFKSTRMPCIIVRESSGEDCKMYALREKKYI